MQKEAEQIATVLQTGSLKVRPKLESVNKTGARLAGESKDRGVYATILSLVLTLGFMVLYYRATGMVANLALLLNAVLIVGTMAFFEAVLTLPGIAGIALTLGMAVDSNILINERIREERMAGRSLRRAVHEGYDRALTTIIDANATTLITGVFLYAYGSGRGPGLRHHPDDRHLHLRVHRGLRDAGGERVAHAPRVAGGDPDAGDRDPAPASRGSRLRRVFAPISALGVVFGLAMFFGEDPYTLYDVDFTGGFKLQARFQEPTTVDDVRSALSGERPHRGGHPGGLRRRGEEAGASPGRSAPARTPPPRWCRSARAGRPRRSPSSGGWSRRRRWGPRPTTRAWRCSGRPSRASSARRWPTG